MDRAVDEKIIKMLEEYAGPFVRELALSRITTYQHLNNQDPKIRFAALALIHMNWGVTQQIADLCEKTARNDSDAKIRGLAITCLWSHYKEKSDSRIGKMLATIVCDEREDPDVREVAYRGLFYLREIVPAQLPSPLGFKFPDDIDWGFVYTFLQSQ
jgi:hypothetical protein